MVKSIKTRFLTASIGMAIAFLLPPISFADDSQILEIYQDKSVSILTTLLEQGVTKVGQIDIEALKSQTPKVQWRLPSPNEQVPAFVGQRASAYYITDSNAVVVTSDPRDFTPEIAEVISLHEALGALGIKDEQYQTSIGLKLLSESKSPEARSFLKLNLEFMGGTGTSVGGGGDYPTLTIKMALIDQLRKQPLYLSTLLFASNLSIEPIYENNDGEVRLSFNERGFPVVNVPVNAWTQGSDFDRGSLLNELTHLVGLLFPLNTQLKMVGTFRCKSAMGPQGIYGSAYNQEIESYLESKLHGQGCTVSSETVSPKELMLHQLKQRESK